MDDEDVFGWNHGFSTDQAYQFMSNSSADNQFRNINKLKVERCNNQQNNSLNQVEEHC